MDARASGSDEDLTTLPLDALRQLVYAEGADETDERRIRAAAELTRRERASSPAAVDPRDAEAPAESSASAQEPPDPASVRSLLGTDILGRSRAMGISGILDRQQEQADTPPRSPDGDVDLSSIRGVQTSVGLYAAHTISDDVCLLVYPWTGSVPADGDSPGSGIMSCVPSAELAASGLQVTWVANVPTRAFDGSVTMAAGTLTAAVDGNGMVTLASPDRAVAY